MLFEPNGVKRPVASSSPKVGRVLPWTLAAFAAGAAATWITIAAYRTAPTAVPVGFVEPPPPGTQLLAAPLVSPDGRRLALIAADSAGKSRVWTRDLSDAVPHVVDGTDGAAMAFWSPDSQQLSFVALGQVRRVAARRGPVSPVVSANPRSGVWPPDGHLLLAVTGQASCACPRRAGRSSGDRPGI